MPSKDRSETKEDRAAYSPKEFAASFGKHSTWCYRALYAGRIKAISNFGRIMIPASERDRIIGEATTYNPKPRPKKDEEVPELVEAEA